MMRPYTARIVHFDATGDTEDEWLYHWTPDAAQPCGWRCWWTCPWPGSKPLGEVLEALARLGRVMPRMERVAMSDPRWDSGAWGRAIQWGLDLTYEDLPNTPMGRLEKLLDTPYAGATWVFPDEVGYVYCPHPGDTRLFIVSLCLFMPRTIIESEAA